MLLSFVELDQVFVLFADWQQNVTENYSILFRILLLFESLVNMTIYCDTSRVLLTVNGAINIFFTHLLCVGNLVKMIVNLQDSNVLCLSQRLQRKCDVQLDKITANKTH